MPRVTVCKTNLILTLNKKNMSYDENRISDQIDGGLIEKENSIRIDYGIYGKIIDKNPLVRYETLKEAKDDYLQNHNAMIVCEVSEVQKDGTLLIKQERVIKAPQIWLPSNRFIPEFNDYYLCYITINHECGNITKKQEMAYFANTQWNVCGNESVTHWMIVENPKSNKNEY